MGLNNPRGYQEKRAEVLPSRSHVRLLHSSQATSRCQTVTTDRQGPNDNSPGEKKRWESFASKVKMTEDRPSQDDNLPGEKKKGDNPKRDRGENRQQGRLLSGGADRGPLTRHHVRGRLRGEEWRHTFTHYRGFRPGDEAAPDWRSRQTGKNASGTCCSPRHQPLPGIALHREEWGCWRYISCDRNASSEATSIDENPFDCAGSCFHFRHTGGAVVDRGIDSNLDRRPSKTTRLVHGVVRVP